METCNSSAYGHATWVNAFSDTSSSSEVHWLTLMTDALTAFINSSGWYAPIYYLASFVVSAVLPFIPTPLIGALGGTAFGFLPAVSYGVIGLGIGAFTALNLARLIGRPLLLKLMRPEAWQQWEELLGIRSVFVWGVIFLFSTWILPLSQRVSLPYPCVSCG